MTIQKTHPLPSPLPVKPEDWVLYVKEKRSINDFVHDIHKLLLADEALSEQYNSYLYATWPEQAIEGSLSVDDTMAAQMIRDRARIEDSPVQKEKLSSIVKSLKVVLRRYHMSRDERRESLDGEIVFNDEGK